MAGLHTEEPTGASQHVENVLYTLFYMHLYIERCNIFSVASVHAWHDNIFCTPDGALQPVMATTHGDASG